MPAHRRTTYYSRGRIAEWELRRILENSGWRCVRSAGSKSICDLVAFNKEGKVKMIQVKRFKKNKSFTKELKELDDMHFLYPHFSWELWVRKDRGQFERVN
ncbi:MAG: hypothetical protein QXR60_03830 [Candidatus Nanoarchaeia archaeon]